jgi:transposase
MTYFLGFDVAKAKLDYALVNEQGIEQIYGKVANNETDIATLLLTICGNYPDISLQCVVESTSTYHLVVAETSHVLGIGCQIYNPIITKQQIKATIRGKKTDRTDATMIARLGLRGEGRPYTPEPYLAAKYYARSAQKLSVLSGLFKKHHDHITSLLGDDLSPESQALLVGVQEAIAAARKQLNQDMAAAAESETYRLLKTVKGIGPYVAASVIGEVQDIKRFKSAKALAAYAGLDPKIRQSGKVLNSTGRLTKRGSTHLRCSLFIAAGVARQYDPQFKALYDKKRAEGKCYKVATCAVARKLLMVIRSVWLSGKDYTVPEAFQPRLT